MRAQADRLRDIVIQEHTRQHNVGCAVTILRGGQAPLRIEIGDACLEDGVPMRAATRGHIASVSKAFTAAAVLGAAGRGLLALDAPIQEYVPQYPVKPEGAVTVELLADHRAGIRHYGAEWTPQLLATRFETALDVLPLFRDDPLVATPDTEYRYSNYGYVLLAAALERVTGGSFEQALRTLVLDPLGLAETGSQAKPGDACEYSFYDAFSFKPLGAMQRLGGLDWSHGRGAGDLLSTADDMAAFGDALFGGKLVGERERSLLDAPPDGARKSRFGWHTSGPWRYLTGSLPGAQAALFVSSADRTTIALLSNAWGQGSETGALCLVVPELLGGVLGIETPAS